MRQENERMRQKDKIQDKGERTQEEAVKRQETLESDSRQNTLDRRQEK